MKWLFLLFALPAVAQTTTIIGKLQTYNPAIAPNALGNYVEFQLTNCGNNTPQVSGVAVLLQKAVDFYPDATGALTAVANGGNSPTLYGNDVISCGGAFTSRYSVRYFVGGIPQGPAKFYYVSSASPFNLTTALPINLQPPLNPPYPNLTKCQPGQYTIGLNKDLSVQCVNLPSGASNAIVSNPAGSQYIAQPAGTSFRPNELFGLQIVDGLTNTTLQQAITAAGTTGTVIIPPDFTGNQGYTNPNSLAIWDLRIGGNIFYRQNLVIPTTNYAQLLGFNNQLLKADSSGKIVPAVAGTDYSSPGTGVLSFNTRAGAVTLSSGDVTGALGYTPPTGVGGGASGTWPINVTGTAGTAGQLTNTPSTCPAGQFARGITANGTAVGCATPINTHSVVAVADFRSCALVHYGDSDQNCASTQAWGVTIVGSYTTVCTINTGFMGGGADPNGTSQTTFGINATSTTGFGYYIANIHDGAAGSTVQMSCAALQ